MSFIHFPKSTFLMMPLHNFWNFFSEITFKTNVIHSEENQNQAVYWLPWNLFFPIATSVIRQKKNSCS